MDAERLKRIASGCLVLIACFFAFLGLDNWFGSAPAIREVKQSISSIDSKQFKNASYSDSRIEKLEREVIFLKSELESLSAHQRYTTDFGTATIAATSLRAFPGEINGSPHLTRD